MANEVVFLDGLMFKKPDPRAPDFVIAKGSIKVSELREFLDKQDTEWVNFDVKESKNGNYYGAVDTWKPTKDQEYKEGMDKAKKAAEPTPPPAGDFGDFDDDIPF